jgi:3-hydroxyisobutyrate dehydrogenase-like beta-hydroxyacid dehydrogenase
MKVAFIGLGRMGRAMAGRLLAGGHELTVYNRTASKADELGAAGASVAGSIAEACDGAEAVLTMLADDAALEEVALGPGGIRESLAAGAAHVASGTHGVAAIKAVSAAHQEAGQAFVAAPVLGRPEAAAAGQIGIVPGGPEDAVERCLPLFEAMGNRIFRAGPLPESASAIKLANNFVLGCAVEAIGEGIALVRKYDVDPHVFHEVLSEGLFAAPAYKTYGRIIADEDWDHVGFTVELALKDARLVLAAADLAQLPLPSANVYRDRLLTAAAEGDDQKDWAIMARVQARSGGLA